MKFKTGDLVKNLKQKQIYEVSTKEEYFKQNNCYPGLKNAFYLKLNGYVYWDTPDYYVLIKRKEHKSHLPSFL